MAVSFRPRRETARELKTVRAMIGIFCRDRHASGRELCAGCSDLWDYAQARVECCPFGEEKPTCANCTVHCYKPEARERIRAVMRYAGPRMTWRHPILTFFHVLNGQRPAPELKYRLRNPPP